MAKVKSPTGRPSRISSGNRDALNKFAAGKPTGGKRPKAKAKPARKAATRAQRMDMGMALGPVGRKKK